MSCPPPLLGGITLIFTFGVLVPSTLLFLYLPLCLFFSPSAPTFPFSSCTSNWSLTSSFATSKALFLGERVEAGEEDRGRKRFAGLLGDVTGGRGGVEAQNFSPSSQMEELRSREVVLGVVGRGLDVSGDSPDFFSSYSFSLVDSTSTVGMDDICRNRGGVEMAVEPRSISSSVASPSQSKPKSPTNALPFCSSHASSSSSS